MNHCDGCRFCCWSFSIPIRPEKPQLEHCPYECQAGCSLYFKSIPVECKFIDCPYLFRDDLHRPDEFQELFERLHPTLGGYVPIISKLVPKSEAVELIEKTRTFPGAFTRDASWMYAIMPLDRQVDNTWKIEPESYKPWREMYLKYRAEFIC